MQTYSVRKRQGELDLVGDGVGVASSLDGGLKRRASSQSGSRGTEGAHIGILGCMAGYAVVVHSSRKLLLKSSSAPDFLPRPSSRNSLGWSVKFGRLAERDIFSGDSLHVFQLTTSSLVYIFDCRFLVAHRQALLANNWRQVTVTTELKLSSRQAMTSLLRVLVLL